MGEKQIENSARDSGGIRGNMARESAYYDAIREVQGLPLGWDTEQEWKARRPTRRDTWVDESLLADWTNLQQARGFPGQLPRVRATPANRLGPAHGGNALRPCTYLWTAAVTRAKKNETCRVRGADRRPAYSPHRKGGEGFGPCMYLVEGPTDLSIKYEGWCLKFGLPLRSLPPHSII